MDNSTITNVTSCTSNANSFSLEHQPNPLHLILSECSYCKLTDYQQEYNQYARESNFQLALESLAVSMTCGLKHNGQSMDMR